MGQPVSLLQRATLQGVAREVTAVDWDFFCEQAVPVVVRSSGRGGRCRRCTSGWCFTCASEQQELLRRVSKRGAAGVRRQQGSTVYAPLGVLLARRGGQYRIMHSCRPVSTHAGGHKIRRELPSPLTRAQGRPPAPFPVSLHQAPMTAACFLFTCTCPLLYILHCGCGTNRAPRYTEGLYICMKQLQGPITLIAPHPGFV